MTSYKFKELLKAAVTEAKIMASDSKFYRAIKEKTLSHMKIVPDKVSVETNDFDSFPILNSDYAAKLTELAYNFIDEMDLTNPIPQKQTVSKYVSQLCAHDAKAKESIIYELASFFELVVCGLEDKYKVYDQKISEVLKSGDFKTIQQMAAYGAMILALYLKSKIKDEILIIDLYNHVAYLGFSRHRFELEPRHIALIAIIYAITAIVNDYEKAYYAICKALDIRGESAWNSLQNLKDFLTIYLE